MVQRSPAQSSQLRGWYSAGVPAGSTLHRLTHSTLKVKKKYVAAISAYHASLGGQSVGETPWLHVSLHGALRPSVWSRVPSWELAVVLKALCRPSFKPIEEISDRHLSLKTKFLLAISSLKRVGDLQALSVAHNHLYFAPGMAKAFPYPRTGLCSKGLLLSTTAYSTAGFWPSPFQELDQQKHNCMCPVQALDAYIHRAAPAEKGGPIASLLRSPQDKADPQPMDFGCH